MNEPYTGGNIIDFVFNEAENMITITRFERSGSVYLIRGSREVPGKVWKEVYAVNTEGKLFLKEIKKGHHITSHLTEEKFEFD